MSLCTGAVGCGCQFTHQVLVDAMKERTKEEGDVLSYPQKPKYIVHYTDDWYCSSKDCGHPISRHPPAMSLHPPTLPTKLAPHVFEVTFTIPKALNMKGARAAVYRCAETYHGFYTSARDAKTQTNIVSDTTSKELRCTVLFKEERDALDFRHAVDDFQRSPCGFSADKLRFAPSSLVPGEPIFLSHYDPKATTSPRKDVAELTQSNPTSSHHSFAEPEGDLFKYQMLERPKPVSLFKPEKCHLVDHPTCRDTDKWRKYDNDENNRLALYRDGLHNMLDGLQTERGLPKIILSVKHIHETCTETVCTDPTGSGAPCILNGRRRVDVRITPLDDTTRAVIQPLLKDGTLTDDAGFVSFVYPPNAKKFGRCLQWNEDFTRKRVREE